MRIDASEALNICRNRLCSDCWEPITEVVGSYDPQERTVEICCTTEGCAFHGHVARGTVERQETESAAQAREATRNLTAAGAWARMAAPKSAQKLLSELGF
jgi:hypothetical protein